MKNPDEISDAIQKFLEEMIDHVDSVAVVYTRYDGDNTIVDGQSKGNAYAVDGSLQAWYRKRMTNVKPETTGDEERI